MAIFIEKMPKVGQLIFTRLKEMERTQTWLSSKIGYSTVHLNHICTGKSTNPNINFFIKTAEILEIPIGELVNAYLEDNKIQ